MGETLHSLCLLSTQCGAAVLKYQLAKSFSISVIATDAILYIYTCISESFVVLCNKPPSLYHKLPLPFVLRSFVSTSPEAVSPWAERLPKQSLLVSGTVSPPVSRSYVSHPCLPLSTSTSCLSSLSNLMSTSVSCLSSPSGSVSICLSAGRFDRVQFSPDLP